jgi:DUF4097 and DUF4098 domain-containing protein YvlB
MLKRAITTSFLFLVALTIAGDQHFFHAAAALAGRVVASDDVADEVTEEFHQTYPLAADGRVSLENLNGSVHIGVWDRNEVEVYATKRAYRRERLAEATIDIMATADTIRIRTRYPERNQTFTDDERGRQNNPAVVDYKLTVPRKARLQTVELINGSLDVAGVEGDVSASSVNGALSAEGLMGEAKLSTVNGKLEARFTSLDATKPISLGSVNGSVVLVIPSDANAELRASTVHGEINNDFGLSVEHGEYVGHELYGQLGTGGPRIKLGNVNGAISIKHADDGRKLSQAVSLGSDKLKRKDRDKEKEKDKEVEASIKDLTEQSLKMSEDARRMAEQISREAMAAAQSEIVSRQAQAESQRALERSLREAQREVEQAQRQIQREVQVQTREQLRLKQVALADLRRAKGERFGRRFVERETRSFSVTGTPRVTVNTFDGAVTIHGWDKSEVSYTATKRAAEQEALKRIEVKAEQQGTNVSITASATEGETYLEVFVPRNAVVYASTTDGRMSADGVSGEITLRTGDGAIEVREGHGRLQVNTGDGSVKIADFDGQVDARSGDGSIFLNGNFSDLTARTGGGSIWLSVPPAANFTLETNADAVTNEGLTITQDVAPSKSVQRWKIGKGGPLFKLHTSDGRVVLRPQ